ncbi:ThiF family adenylyltransferase [Streptococcus pseudopneumoniae]|uniref:HesA/MoeB/ThiF family protein n=1 Tax=Streptococcus pseudopneumoniae TaxID=257758 RepID=UPI0018B03015|nr:ThiF family adenylyltransferase [Streptococcus pseudopneumoniae]MBF9646065.1 ThiF family adenylyltransferase [Streptococcus pseudopneumoniae]
MDLLKARPKLKKAYPVVYKDGSVYIGGVGEITEYEDPSGAIEYMLKKMDGINTVEKIIREVSETYSELSPSDVMEAIDEISKERFIEDLNLTGSKILSKYELERYHRNINFFSSYATLSENKYISQKKLIDSKIGIIGLGGLGSHIIYDLAGLGIGEIKAVEFDVVDISNLNRQILYNFDDIGKSKASIAKQRIYEFNPQIKFTVEEKKINSSEDVVESFRGFDCLILVADRPKVKLARWVNEAIVKLNIPLFCAGLEAQRALQYTIIPKISGCIDCWRNTIQKEHPISHLILEERTRLNLVGDNTAIAPLVSVATGIICSEVTKYITGIGELTTVGQLKSIDMNTMTTKIAEHWHIDPNCITCRGGNIIE